MWVKFSHAIVHRQIKGSPIKRLRGLLLSLLHGEKNAEFIYFLGDVMLRA